MKKIYFFFTIFLFLIVLSSFSWVDAGYVGSYTIPINDTYENTANFFGYTVFNYLVNTLHYTSSDIFKGSNNQGAILSEYGDKSYDGRTLYNAYYFRTFYNALVNTNNSTSTVGHLNFSSDYNNVFYIFGGTDSTQSNFIIYMYNNANYSFFPNNIKFTESTDKFLPNFNIDFSQYNSSFVYNNANLDFFNLSLSGGGGGSQSYYFEPILMIDDMNFKKSFKFSFQIAQIRADTKYYLFLKNYTRNSYTSVTGDFVVLTVTTPSEYDYSKYYNYLYYDDYLEELNLPAGCEVHIYTGSGNNNTQISLSEVSIDNNNIIPHYNLGSLTNLYYNDVNTHQLFSTYTYNDLIPTNYNISGNSIGKVITSILNALELKQNINDNTSLRFNIIDAFLPYLNNSTFTSEEFRKSYYLQALYYGIDKYTSNSDFNNAMSIIKNYNNFICGNYSIISYENSKFDTSFGVPYYELYRSTKIYNCDNQVNENFYRFQYTDKEDVSSMLPNGVSVDYLTSPFYQQNDNSSSGGYITYNITEVLYGDNPINYGINESPIRIAPQEDYITNDDDTDNQPLNDNSTQQIDNSSSDNFLKGIYQAVLKIQDILSKQSIQNQNNITNITYNIEQNFKYFFIPQERFF